MNSNRKSTKDAFRETERRSPPSAAPFVNLLHEGMASFAEVQKTVLDGFVRQTSAASDVWRQVCGLSTAARAGYFVDMAGESAEKLVDAQKHLLDLTAEQAAAVTALFERQLDLSETTPAAAVADSIRRGMEIGMETQKQLLAIAFNLSQPPTAARAGD